MVVVSLLWYGTGLVGFIWGVGCWPSTLAALALLPCFVGGCWLGQLKKVVVEKGRTRVETLQYLSEVTSCGGAWTFFGEANMRANNEIMR